MMFKFIHLFFLDWELSYIVPMSVVFSFFREHTILAAVPASLRQEFILHCALLTLVLSDYRLASQWTWHLPHTHTQIHPMDTHRVTLLKAIKQTVVREISDIFRSFPMLPWYIVISMVRYESDQEETQPTQPSAFKSLWWSMMIYDVLQHVWFRFYSLKFQFGPPRLPRLATQVDSLLWGRQLSSTWHAIRAICAIYVLLWTRNESQLPHFPCCYWTSWETLSIHFKVAF